MRTLAQLRQQCKDCKECPLGEKRGKKEHVVFGEGPEDARIMFINERPIDLDAELGRPLRGKVGNFFNRLLNTVGVDRDEVFVTNAVMCAPPESGEVTAKELAACSKWLHETIRIVDPVLIIAMGNNSVSTLVKGAGAVTHNYGRVVLADIPGAAIAYQVPVGILASPAFIRREGEFSPNSHGHCQLWGMQHLVKWADQLAHEYYRDPIKRRGEINFTAPDIMKDIPRVTPDEAFIVDDDEDED